MAPGGIKKSDRTKSRGLKPVGPTGVAGSKIDKSTLPSSAIRPKQTTWRLPAIFNFLAHNRREPSDECDNDISAETSTWRVPAIFRAQMEQEQGTNPDDADMASPWLLASLSPRSLSNGLSALQRFSFLGRQAFSSEESGIGGSHMSSPGSMSDVLSPLEQESETKESHSNEPHVRCKMEDDEDGKEQQIKTDGREDFQLVVDDVAEGEQVPTKQKLISSADPRFQDWADEEIWIYNRLMNRGNEPVMPAEWKAFFNTFPEAMFIDDSSKSLISSLGGTRRADHTAANAFNLLFQTGTACRANEEAPEPIIGKRLAWIISWAIKDIWKAKRMDYLPLIVRKVASSDEDATSVVDSLMDNFVQLGERWHAKFYQQDGAAKRPLPVLYGFVVWKSVLTIMTWDPSSGGGIDAKPIRTIGTFNWVSDDQQDVWHGIAVAIVVCRMRDILKAYDDEGAWQPETTDTDPDA